MTIDTTHSFIALIADDGKVFRQKSTGIILNNVVLLGCNDRADDYEEVVIEDIEVEQINEETEDGVQQECIHI